MSASQAKGKQKVSLDNNDNDDNNDEYVDNPDPDNKHTAKCCRIQYIFLHLAYTHANNWTGQTHQQSNMFTNAYCMCWPAHLSSHSISSGSLAPGGKKSSGIIVQWVPVVPLSCNQSDMTQSINRGCPLTTAMEKSAQLIAVSSVLQVMLKEASVQERELELCHTVDSLSKGRLTLSGWNGSSGLETCPVLGR
jgi:hypothetical protein